MKVSKKEIRSAMDKSNDRYDETEFDGGDKHGLSYAQFAVAVDVLAAAKAHAHYTAEPFDVHSLADAICQPISDVHGACLHLVKAGRFTPDKANNHYTLTPH